jgi:hypothetical protein
VNEAQAQTALDLVAGIEQKREEQKPLLRKLRMWAELALQGYTHEMVESFGTDPERVMALVEAHERAVRAEARTVRTEEGLWRNADCMKAAREKIPRPGWMVAANPPGGWVRRGGGGASRAMHAWRPPVYTKVLVDGAWEDLEPPVGMP